MPSGSESRSGGNRIRRSTAASQRGYVPWNPSMDTPF